MPLWNIGHILGEEFGEEVESVRDLFSVVLGNLCFNLAKNKKIKLKTGNGFTNSHCFGL